VGPKDGGAEGQAPMTKVSEVFPPLTDEQKGDLLQFVPRWHACIVGPIPEGQVAPMVASFDNIVQMDKDAALDEMYEHLEGVLAHHGIELDFTEWHTDHCFLVNGN
jgi:hypothetical protein